MADLSSFDAVLRTLERASRPRTTEPSWARSVRARSGYVTAEFIRLFIDRRGRLPSLSYAIGLYSVAVSGKLDLDILSSDAAAARDFNNLEAAIWLPIIGRVLLEMFARQLLGQSSKEQTQAALDALPKLVHPAYAAPIIHLAAGRGFEIEGAEQILDGAAATFELQGELAVWQEAVDAATALLLAEHAPPEEIDFPPTDLATSYACCIHLGTSATQLSLPASQGKLLGRLDRFLFRPASQQLAKALAEKKNL